MKISIKLQYDELLDKKQCATEFTNEWHSLKALLFDTECKAEVQNGGQQLPTMWLVGNEKMLEVVGLWLYAEYGIHSCQ